MKKPIIVKPENLPRIAEEIKAAEGRANARTISADDVHQLASALERHLLHYCLKKDLPGTRVVIDMHAQSFGRAYKKAAHNRPAQSTHFILLRGSSCWKLIDVWRADCGETRYRIEWTPAAIDRLCTDIKTPWTLQR